MNDTTTFRTSATINELATALAKAQGEFQNPPKDKTATVRMKTGGTYTYQYADVADVLSHTLPVLAKHDLSVVQPTQFAGDSIIIITRVMHSSGQWMESEYPVCPVKGEHQNMGGALTYARRYAFCSLIGVAAEEDKSGEGASKIADTGQMSAHAARKDFNWVGFEADINTADTGRKLDGLFDRAQVLTGAWHEQAEERIAMKRAELAASALQVAPDAEKLGKLYDGASNLLEQGKFTAEAWTLVDEAYNNRLGEFAVKKADTLIEQRTEV